MEGVSLVADTVHSVAAEYLDVPDDIAALPDAKGFDGLRRIRDATSAAVTIVSACGSRRVKEQALALGAASFVEKSGDIDEFYAALRQVLGAR